MFVINLIYAAAESNTVLDVPTAATESEAYEDFKWTRASILMLIDNCLSKKADFSDPQKKKKRVLESVALIMKAHSYHVTWAVCEKKIRNMKQTYKNIKDNNGKTENRLYRLSALNEYQLTEQYLNYYSLLTHFFRVSFNSATAFTRSALNFSVDFSLWPKPSSPQPLWHPAVPSPCTQISSLVLELHLLLKPVELDWKSCAILPSPSDSCDYHYIHHPWSPDPLCLYYSPQCLDVQPWDPSQKLTP